jgi:prolyl 4-hydroxylase
MTGKPLTQEWQLWLVHNQERGCAPLPLFQRALAQGFDPEQVSAVLKGFRPSAADNQGLAAAEADAGPSDPEEQLIWRAMAAAPLTDPGQRPRAWRVDTSQAQLYEVPGLVSPEECEQLMALIDQSLKPSTVTRGPADYRTSRTCHLKASDGDLVVVVNQRICKLIGIPEDHTETLQGQRYDVGEYFKAHTDWFAPNTEEFTTHTARGGQRTWTVMVYLNQVEAGGETCFARIGRCFTPQPGLALAWNNLHASGAPNHDTLHEAMPILAGSKYVLTKWCRTGRWQS